MDAALVLGTAGGLLAAWAAVLVLLWLVRPRDVRLAELVSLVPDVLRLVRDLLGDRTVPRRARLALVVLLAWLISRIDLIPEFIPVLGPIDDVVIAVLVLRYVRRTVGIDGLRAQWRGSAAGFEVLTSIVGAGLICSAPACWRPRLGLRRCNGKGPANLAGPWIRSKAVSWQPAMIPCSRSVFTPLVQVVDLPRSDSRPSPW